MTDLDTIHVRMKHLTYAWMSLCLGFVAGIFMLLIENKHLRIELEELRAKPVHITYQQKHEAIKDYMAVDENRLALRKIIGCK